MHSDPLRLRSDLLLLLAAFIWGFAFVAQRTGVEHIGSMAFTSIRFFIGGLVLLPIIVAGERKRRPAALAAGRQPPPSERRRLSRRRGRVRSRKRGKDHVQSRGSMMELRPEPMPRRAMRVQ